MKLDLLASALSLAPLVAGHGAVTSYIVAGKNYAGYDGFAPSNSPTTIERQWKDYNPVMQAGSAAMLCNGGTSAKLTAPVNAGENVTAVYKQWTHQQGPVMVWMFKCAGEFAACSGQGRGWFKIDQLGLISPPLSGNNWGTGLIYKNLKWTSQIPRSLPSGNYLIRHELLALHQANTPQFYPECAQLVVTGTGSKLPPADFMFSIPGYAPQSDPGITVDVSTSKATTYTCPGGPVWTGF